MTIPNKIKPTLSWFPDNIEINDIQFEWESFLEELDEELKIFKQNRYWYCTVSNFGWQNLDGKAYLQFITAKDMLYKVLPKTDCCFNIFIDKNIIRIQNYHHDSPTGNEWYELNPITEKEYNSNKCTL